MNPGQNNQGGNRQGGLSWSSPQSTNKNSSTTTPTSPLLGGQKPVSQTSSKPASAPKPQGGKPSTNATRNAGLVIGGLVVLALIIWGLRSMSSTPVATNNATSTPNSSENTASVANGTNQSLIANTGDIEVASQPAGSQVVITDATVSKPTWLVVYELANGKPVRALGATMFFPEYNGKGGIIQLVRATQPNTTYFIGESEDTGSHTFTIHVNKDVLDTNGKMVGSTFTTN